MAEREMCRQAQGQQQTDAAKATVYALQGKVPQVKGLSAPGSSLIWAGGGCSGEQVRDTA